MKWWTTFALLLFSAVWIGWSLTFGNEQLMPSDCVYMQTEDCRARLRFGPELLFWRTATVELAAIVVYLFVRNR